MDDITPKINISQFGGQKGIWTEHLLVCMVIRIFSLLDNNTDASAAAMVDWASAFDRQNPTKDIQKFLKMGVRNSLIPVLVPLS